MDVCVTGDSRAGWREVLVWDLAGGLDSPDRRGATGDSGTLDHERWGSRAVAGNVMRGILSQSQHAVGSRAT